LITKQSINVNPTSQKALMKFAANKADGTQEDSQQQ
jgi:hypothetical protein